MTFGERIVALRKARKITQAEPRLITFICLSSVLDVSLDYLARGENWRKSDE